MEKKTWNENLNEENGGGWDYSNKQKNKMRAEQKKAEAAERKKTAAAEKKIAAAASASEINKKPLEPIIEADHVDSDPVLVEVPAVSVQVEILEIKETPKTWKWWWWWG